MSLREINSQVNKQLSKCWTPKNQGTVCLHDSTELYVYYLFIYFSGYSEKTRCFFYYIIVYILCFCILSHNHSYSYFQLVNTNTAEAYLANQQMSSIANFGKYCQLPKLENIVGYQLWQILWTPKLPKLASVVGYQNWKILWAPKLPKLANVVGYQNWQIFMDT